MSTGYRRLLDMLAGWSEYVDGAVGDADASADDYRREAVAIAEVYQAAGARAEMTDEDVERFVARHVMPLLLEGEARFSVLNVTEVEARDEYRLRVAFSDGTSGVANMRETIEGIALLKPLLDEALFRQAYVDMGTVCWPGDLDIAAEAVYALAHGLPHPDTLEQVRANEAEMRARSRSTKGTR